MQGAHAGAAGRPRGGAAVAPRLPLQRPAAGAAPLPLPLPLPPWRLPPQRHQPRTAGSGGGGGPGPSRPVAAAAQVPPPAALAPAPAAAAAAATTGPADPCLALSGDAARAVGALLGAMCGNALGAQVEPERHYRLARLLPDGPHDMSWSLDLSRTPLPPGHVTGDFGTMLAVAWSLARRRGADPYDVLDCLVRSYEQQPSARYSPYSALALQGLAAGTNPFLLPHHAEGLLALTPSRASQSCSHRPDRQLHGPGDFTAVVRGVPVGLAYRDAPPAALQAAVDAAVMATHPTEAGAAGPAAVASAVAWLARADPAAAEPEQLLEHLLGSCASSADMHGKLLLLRESLPQLRQLGAIGSWRQFWASAEWARFTGVANRLWKQNLAVQGTQAAALALWVQLVSWRHPKQAVMLAAALGGYAATTGSLVGAMAGALHGCDWVPAEWWAQLQEDGGGGGGPAERPAARQEPPGRGGRGWDEEEGEGEEQRQLREERERAAREQAEARGRAVAAEAAAAVALASGAEEEEEEEGGGEGALLDDLRVGKYSVVLLGHELAALSCSDVSPALG